MRRYSSGRGGSVNRVEYIRREEKKYHDSCYENYTLFEKGSWLYKPVKTVLEQLSLLKGKQDIRVLDLGSGVGRNSIPIANEIKSSNGKVVCVDLLSSAIKKLSQYCKEYGVEQVIELVQSDIAEYQIKQKEYDYIVAVSSLEHVASESIFDSVLEKMAAGTKEGGLNCIIVNSEVEEVDIETNEQLDALMEVNLKTEDMIHKIRGIYNGWEVVKQVVKPLE